ncbi:hypothetical protein [Janthinobacterium sp. B9-8]|uniref:hypothetical protein n=1 Tax=Janthinobacterium sp. B9-8 TaxID=1236179 RepID=UPI00061D0F4D|nr:hypothetical protein [Janthinobacterium sp. B9-8]AMC34371.1 hypothetical protein VN23_07025 [Janthinobacterium sp. B9-8]
MRYIADDFIVESKKQSIFCVEMAILDAVYFSRSCEEKFFSRGDTPLWSRVSSLNSSLYLLGEKCIFSNFIGKDIVVFFEQDVDSTVFLLNDFKEMSLSVEELFGFVFFVSNLDMDFAIC